jgi:hypothetical protein
MAATAEELKVIPEEVACYERFKDTSVRRMGKLLKMLAGNNVQLVEVTETSAQEEKNHVAWHASFEEYADLRPFFSELRRGTFWYRTSLSQDQGFDFGYSADAALNRSLVLFSLFDALRRLAACAPGQLITKLPVITFRNTPLYDFEEFVDGFLDLDMSFTDLEEMGGVDEVAKALEATRNERVVMSWAVNSRTNRFRLRWGAYATDSLDKIRDFYSLNALAPVLRPVNNLVKRIRETDAKLALIDAKIARSGEPSAKPMDDAVGSTGSNQPAGNVDGAADSSAGPSVSSSGFRTASSSLKQSATVYSPPVSAAVSAQPKLSLVRQKQLPQQQASTPASQGPILAGITRRADPRASRAVQQQQLQN